MYIYTIMYIMTVHLKNITYKSISTAGESLQRIPTAFVPFSRGGRFSSALVYFFTVGPGWGESGDGMPDALFVKNIIIIYY